MSIRNDVLDLFFPPRCAFCHRLLPSQGNGVCTDCEKNLPYTSGSDIKQRVPFVSCVIAPLYYEGSVRESLLRYKFGRCTGYADVYARILVTCLQESSDIKYDLVSWVPLSAKRLRKRGYDQARLVAEKTAALLEIEAVPTLRKVRNVRAQSGVGSAEKRRANISGAYAVPDVKAVEGKKILLVDDIITTGSTLSECARTLGMAGAGKTSAAAVARHRD